jgi:hypothetical protein
MGLGRLTSGTVERCADGSPRCTSAIPSADGPRRHIMVSIMCAQTTTTLLRRGCTGCTRVRGGVAEQIPGMRDAC